jgi:lysophospholipase L1-like esterase
MRRSVGAAALLMCTGCGNPAGPSSNPPPVTEITLTCPADIRLGSIGTPTALVTYPPPTASGGTPPINVTCTPPSGTSFPLGTTNVNCSGTDGTRSAVCSFRVTLVPPQPVLSVLNYVAFGDSITAGENGEKPLLFIDGANSYPMQLLGLMQGRYTTQTPQVHNCGLEGETVEEGAVRVDPVLDFYKADVLLLLEGINSLTGNFPRDAVVVQGALAHDIAAAKSRGMAGVFMSTLLPVFPTNCGPSTATCRAVYDNVEITNINGVIFALAQQQGVPLIDNYTAFQGHPEYIDGDGLHPLPLGNHVLAQQFLAAIESKFEFLQPTGAQRLSRASPLAISPQCPHDGQTAVTVSRSSGR